MPTRNVPIEAAGPLAADVMLRAPRTVAPETTVAEARAMFENARVRLLLVARAGSFLGTITRTSIPDDAAGDLALGTLVTTNGDLVAPHDPLARVVELLEARQTDRLPVVSDEGAIVGLVCFNRKHGHFCIDG